MLRNLYNRTRQALSSEVFTCTSVFSKSYYAPMHFNGPLKLGINKINVKKINSHGFKFTTHEYLLQFVTNKESKIAEIQPLPDSVFVKHQDMVWKSNSINVIGIKELGKYDWYNNESIKERFEVNLEVHLLIFIIFFVCIIYYNKKLDERTFKKPGVP